MKKLLIISIFCIITVCSASAQNILTASAFFQSVSEYYGTIKDYEANMQITAARSDMYGKVSFKRPNLLRIDFSNPENQVIVFNGETLTIYLPGPSAALIQSVTASSEQSGMSLATPQGLSLMSRYYSVAYEIGQAPVQLDETTDEKVIKLILSRRNSSEGFRTIKLAVNPETKLIRRVEAVTPQNETFVFLFSDYVLNQNISVQRFVYDAPSSANNYNNFLFSE
ncbi:LolA family protein [Treponema brennaborense]|uniref:Outer membrane lipoprotein carrier protein LolA n=1 Tax=Treponema brennaborense (strain DSM 12168 / CIP 105900 / DD5/3) TaxID=906968 RepID=F4LPG0_TREBD|nr:outer membrane lipoprotein carrier protein LolA [Treponema brennaborense]AEE15971.1 outer membrane lipoprotein carrier protein LolA [Treponema brennaborense DSM 12168]